MKNTSERAYRKAIDDVYKPADEFLEHVESQITTTACRTCQATPENACVIQWGQANGSQRYRCKNCSQTFSEENNHPTFHSHYTSLTWRRFITAMLDQWTLKETADCIGITVQTAHRWRTRLMTAMKRLQSGVQFNEGIAWGDETFISAGWPGQCALLI